jgi:hypothetical protein
MSVSPELLLTVARELSGLSLDPAHLEPVVPQLSAQLAGLAALDELDLETVEPAIVLRTDLEGQP